MYKYNVLYIIILHYRDGQTDKRISNIYSVLTLERELLK